MAGAPRDQGEEGVTSRVTDETGGCDGVSGGDNGGAPGPWARRGGPGGSRQYAWAPERARVRCALRLSVRPACGRAGREPGADLRSGREALLDLALAGGVGLGCDGQADPERRALARAAVHAHVPAVHLGDALDEVQADPEPAARVRVLGHVLAEELEDVGRGVGGDARAAVVHLDAHARAVLQRAQAHGRAARGGLDRGYEPGSEAPPGRTEG